MCTVSQQVHMNIVILSKKNNFYNAGTLIEIVYTSVHVHENPHSQFKFQINIYVSKSCN